jgi:hypothetical protein
VSLRIHFTARLLFQNRLKGGLRDRRLRPGLFRKFKLDPDAGGEGSSEWVVKESPRWFLSEDGVNSHEKQMLDEWIDWARSRAQEPDGHDPDRLGDVVWRGVLRHLGELGWEDYMETYQWERSFIRLVWMEFGKLGILATEEGAA